MPRSLPGDRTWSTTLPHEYDALAWANEEASRQAWCEGRTGYPLVDAAMRELNAVGRCIIAFACSPLHFWSRIWASTGGTASATLAEKLLDYDLASNNGGWQWAASTGCDAQPWFRIFNPVTQSRKFDSDGAFIRRWVPELAWLPDGRVHAPWEMTPLEQQAAGCIIDQDYQAPVVHHEEARQRTLARFGAVRAQ